MPTNDHPMSRREAEFRLRCEKGRVALLAASPSVEALLGHDAEAFASGRVALPSLIHADDQDVAAMLLSPLAQDPEGDCNLRVRHASGRIVCVKGHYRRAPEGAAVVLDLLLQDARDLPRTLVDVGESAYASSMMENTDDFIYFKDRNHVTTAASQTLVALTPPLTHWTEMIGRTDYDLFEESLADRYYRLEKQVFAGVPIAQEVQEIVRNDGTRGWVDNRKYPIRDAHGTIIGLHGIARDITSTRKAELALRESEARARAIISASPVPMATSDAALRVTFLNPAFTRTFGYDLSDIPTLAEWWPKAYPDPAYRQHLTEVWVAELERCDRTGTPFVPQEVLVRCKDGSDRLVLIVAAPLQSDFSGDCLVLMQDITAIKRSEQQLHRSAVMLAEAQRIAHLGSWELDLATGETQLSDELCRILGFDPALPLPPLSAHETLYTPASWMAMAAAIGETQRTGMPYTIELERRLPDGSQAWLWARGEAVTDAQGTIGGIRGIAQDITDRKRMEQAKAEVEAQLRQSQRLETVGTLAAGIAHDFNNILAAIYGNAELALVDIDPAHPAREHLLEIEQAAARAKTLVQQVLAFSSQHPQTRHPLALGPLVVEATALLRATIPTTVHIETSIDADAPPVLADASQMHQILVNLCTNAWHALEDRPGSIAVRLASVHLDARQAMEIGGLVPGHYARLSVRDDGMGIDAATRERMFDPFFTTKERGKGTGLGLSVVHGIVIAHEGAIQVVSTPGDGATFTIYLPASAESAVVQPPSLAAEPASAEGTGHLLYVDDEAMLTRIGARTMQRLGYRVTAFMHPAEAVQAFTADPTGFDAVITDMNMPGMNGIAFAKEVMRVRPGMPVVLVSGTIDEALRKEAAAVGIAGVVCKPFSMQELGGTLGRVLGASPGLMS